MTRARSLQLLLGAFVVVFGGVTAAFQFNKWLEARSTVSLVTRPALVQPVSLDQAAGNGSDFRAAAKRIIPSVVSVDTQVEGENFFGERVVQDANTGSGVVISPDGYVVTNNHVLRVSVGFGQSQLVDKVRVTFSDGSTAAAKIVGTDPRSDLAVLKVEHSGLSAIDLGDSAKLEVGQWVIAVGNPLGFSNTLSVGVVSNIGRPLPESDDRLFIDGIQTDAAINPGNSGGALCDADGRLIGINSSIATTTRANIGIGFAIPVNRMRQVVADILQYGYAKYGETGVRLLPRKGILGFPEARDQLRQRTGSPSEPPSEGAVVWEVDPGSPASGVGVKPFDVITEVNGRKVKDFQDFETVISPLRPGAQVSVKYWSAGHEKSAKVTLSDAGRASL